MKKFLSTSLFAALFLNSCVKEELVDLKNLTTTDAEAASKNSLNVNTGYEMVPNQMLVKFKPDINANGRANAMARMNAQVLEHIHTAAMKSAGDRAGVFLLRVPIDVVSAVSRAKAFEEIEIAEPNFIYKHDATSNDPSVTGGSTWGLYGSATSPANQFGSGAMAQWTKDNVGSSSVVVGIIDEGVMFNHNDLKDNIWVNPGETANNGLDDDGNGYVDDIRGWDFASNDNTTFDGSSDDHGTHVAGTIGAKGGNSTGVAGVCWNVKMITAKFLGRNGGTTANAIKAVDYITDLKTRHGLDIVATNNSWGGGGFSQNLLNAINNAGSKGILFVAAAGNSSLNMDASNSYPAGYDGNAIISVAALTSGGALASYSNFGATRVDLGAPGSGILSTVPSKNSGSAYASYSGTSMATPHVTGAVALYKSINSSATASQIRTAILSTTATGSLSGKTVTGGRLNVSGW